MTLAVGSLFSGIGGFDLGLERAGMRVEWQVEIDPHAREVLRRNFEGASLYDDVRAVGGASLATVDVVCGGFPCQDLSVAGKRAGLAGERSGLWFEFHRILAELRPPWVVIENVPGLLSSNGGRDFAVVLQGLGELWYRTAWRVLNSEFFGVAQRRRRVFLVGHLGDGRAAEVLFEPESVLGNPPPRRTPRQGAPRNATDGTGTGSAGALAAGNGRGLRGGRGDGNDPFVVEAAVTLLARGHSPGVATPGSGGEEAYGDNLVAYPPAVAAPVLRGGLRYDLDGDTYVPVEVVGALDSEAGGGKLTGQSAANGQKMPIGGTDSLAPTLTARYWKGGSIQGHGMHSWRVRRLLPVECARLQGFPDDWNAFLGDSHRYRQFGNAVTVPVAEWIGRRILEVSA